MNSPAWREAYKAKERRPPLPAEIEPFAQTVARAPRWSWSGLGRTEVESRLHYIARIAAGAPEPYACGVRTCAACTRRRADIGAPPPADERQPGEDG